MRRDTMKRLESRLAPSTMKCILFIQDGREPEGGVSCHYANTTIPYEECPGYNGEECPYCREFVRVQFRTVRAGPNGELQVLGSPEWPFEDDDETVSTTSNEEF